MSLRLNSETVMQMRDCEQSSNNASRVSLYVFFLLIITITISSNVIGALTALFFTNYYAEL